MEKEDLIKYVRKFSASQLEQHWNNLFSANLHVICMQNRAFAFFYAFVVDVHIIDAGDK